MNLSVAKQLALLSPYERLKILESLNADDVALLAHYWPFLARPNQLAPEGDWSYLLALAGRGFGKTRMGVEWVLAKAQEHPGCRIALVGPTQADFRDTMVDGESGILSCAPPWFKVNYQSSKRRVECENGSRIFGYSAEEPERLRGPQFHFSWCDELAAWGRDIETWDMLMFCLRLGKHPQTIVTTTPKPKKIIRDLLKDPDTHVVTGSSYENMDNLSAQYKKQIIKRYEGTRLGRQEIHAELLEDVPGALWTRSNINKYRVKEKNLKDLYRVLSVDIATTSKKTSNETGIILAGLGLDDDHLYVAKDYSGRHKANEWPKLVIQKFLHYNCEKIVVEVNQGGDLIKELLRQVWEGKKMTYELPVVEVSASIGKRARAEPVSLLYERGLVHHIGLLELLEDQLCIWDPMEDNESPDRLDSLVWNLSHLTKRMKTIMSFSADLASIGKQTSAWNFL